jgi:plastocyanin
MLSGREAWSVELSITVGYVFGLIGWLLFFSESFLFGALLAARFYLTQLQQSRLLRACIGVAAALSLLLAGCQDEESTPAARSTAATTSTATPAASAGTSVARPDSASTIHIEMGDNFFAGDGTENGGRADAMTRVTTRAGTIRIEAKNVGVSIHNVNIYDRQGGKSLKATDPLAVPGGGTGVLEVTLQPGNYFYQCDFHPTEMVGTLVVQ